MIQRNRIRAAVNIMGDAYGAAIVEALSKDELKTMDRNNENKKLNYSEREQQNTSIPKSIPVSTDFDSSIK